MSEHTLHLLIVDDEESIRKPLADHLRTIYHYDVDAAGDGQEALRLIDKFQGHFDVALIDQVLEGDISGLELLKEIKAKYSGIQVIVFTGWGMKQDEGINILNQGAYRYIAKPFNLEELALTIRFAAEQRQIRREHEYLSALVQVSKELTYTTDLEKQLVLVWNYVKDQLASPTFYIALYDSSTDTLRFHQSYDEGEPDPLSDRHLGDDSSHWGVAGHVVKIGQEVAWLNHEESEKKWRDLGIRPHISGKGPSEAGICLPLRMGDKILGVLSVQSYQPQAFDRAFLNAVRTLGGQLAPAIENSKLFSELEKTRNHLEGLVEGSLDAAVFIDIDKHITVFNKQAEEMLGYTVDEMRGHTVTILYADITQARLIWNLIDQQQKLVSHEITLKHKDGTEIPALLSAVSVGDGEGNIIGQAGFMRDMRQIYLLEERLRALIRAGQTISESLETGQILQHIVESAIAAFPITEKGSIHLFDEKNERLYIKASIGYPPRVTGAMTLKIGEGFAGWVYEHGVPIVSGDTEKDNRFKAFDYPEIQRQKSMICVPLIVKGQVIGVLSLDNLTINDAFKPEDAELLSSFAGQAANAIENSRLFEETHLREQLLTALDEASGHIRAEKEPTKLLHEIVRLASEMMGCSAGGLCINYPHIEELEMTATYGLPDNLVGTRLPYASLIGKIAQSSTTQVVTNYLDLPDRGMTFKDIGIKTIVGLPLRYAGEVEAVLFVADATSLREFDRNDLEILERFAAQASTALHTSQLLNKNQRKLGQLAILHRISDYIQKAKDLDKILHVVLTGVTAGYGLGFNRAGFMFLDESGKNLAGRMGIGYLAEPDAREDWKRHRKRGLEDFGKYLEASEQEDLPPTPVNENIRLLRLQVKKKESDAFSRAVLEQRWQLITRDELGVLPENFIQAFEPDLPFIVVPMIAREEVIGLLFADNKFTHSPITQEDIDSLVTFANTAAVAIDNVQLITREKEAALKTSRLADRLKVLHEIGAEISSAREVDLIWGSIANHLIRLVGARRSLFLLVDTKGKRLLKATGQGYPLEHLQRMTFSEVEAGISGWVLKTKEAVLIKNAQSDPRNTGKALEMAKDFETAPLIVAPLLIKDESIGTLTVANSVGDPPFDKDDKELVVMLAAQAAIAYNNARRMHELEQLQKVAEALASMLEPTQVLQQIVESACDILQADSSAVWSFDNIRNRTIPEKLVAYGIPKVQLERFRKQAPTQGGTAETVMKKRWVGVADISDPQYSFIGSSTKELLNKIGAKSFQGAALKVGDEKLGVLYVNYNHSRSFTQEDQRILETFAYHAALALKKTSLLEQVGKARDTAKVFAQVSILEDLKTTLSSIVIGTQEVLDCDAVTLYTYDQELDEFDFPPVTVGLENEQAVLKLGKVAKQSVVRNILGLERLHESESAPSDSLLQGPFISREKIKSSVGIPLRVRGRKVGVMFVNYRSTHRFTNDETTNIELFANQAAVAIENAHLYDAAEQQAENLHTVLDVSQTAISSHNLERILNATCRAAVDLLKVDHSGLVLFDQDLAIGKVCAEYPELGTAGVEFPLHGVPAEEQLIATKKPLMVPDVASEPGFDPVRDILTKLGTCSILIVPIVSKGQILGSFGLDVMKHQRVFTEKEVELCKIFAAQVAVAIVNAQQFEELRTMKALVGPRTATEWMRMVSMAWGHAIKRESGLGLRYLELIRQDLETEDIAKAKQDLTSLGVVVERIKDIPIVAPLAKEDTIMPIFINDLIRKHVDRMWQHEPYLFAELIWNLQPDLDDIATVVASPQWVLRCLEIFIDNSINAMVDSNSSSRRVEIATRVLHKEVQILVIDSGPGFPTHLRNHMIGIDPVHKLEGSLGAGLGLVLAKNITQTYGGDIHVVNTGSDGTTMAISLPRKRL